MVCPYFMAVSKQMVKKNILRTNKEKCFAIAHTWCLSNCVQFSKWTQYKNWTKYKTLSVYKRKTLINLLWKTLWLFQYCVVYLKASVQLKNNTASEQIRNKGLWIYDELWCVSDPNLFCFLIRFCDKIMSQKHPEKQLLWLLEKLS